MDRIPPQTRDGRYPDLSGSITRRDNKKELFGNQLAFWGCIGTQTTMPFATPREIKDTVRRLVATVGKGGGLLLAPTHTLEPDVPRENVEAFLAAVNEGG